MSAHQNKSNPSNNDCDEKKDSNKCSYGDEPSLKHPALEPHESKCNKIEKSKYFDLEEHQSVFEENNIIAVENLQTPVKIIITSIGEKEKEAGSGGAAAAAATSTTKNINNNNNNQIDSCQSSTSLSNDGTPSVERILAVVPIGTHLLRRQPQQQQQHHDKQSQHISTFMKMSNLMAATCSFNDGILEARKSGAENDHDEILSGTAILTEVKRIMTDINSNGENSASSSIMNHRLTNKMGQRNDVASSSFFGTNNNNATGLVPRTSIDRGNDVPSRAHHHHHMTEVSILVTPRNVSFSNEEPKLSDKSFFSGAAVALANEDEPPHQQQGKILRSSSEHVKRSFATDNNNNNNQQSNEDDGNKNKINLPNCLDASSSSRQRSSSSNASLNNNNNNDETNPSCSNVEKETSNLVINRKTSFDADVQLLVDNALAMRTDSTSTSSTSSSSFTSSDSLILSNYESKRDEYDRERTSYSAPSQHHHRRDEDEDIDDDDDNEEDDIFSTRGPPEIGGAVGAALKEVIDEDNFHRSLAIYARSQQGLLQRSTGNSEKLESVQIFSKKNKQQSNNNKNNNKKTSVREDSATEMFFGEVRNSGSRHVPVFRTETNSHNINDDAVSTDADSSRNTDTNDLTTAILGFMAPPPATSKTVTDARDN